MAKISFELEVSKIRPYTLSEVEESDRFGRRVCVKFYLRAFDRTGEISWGFFPILSKTTGLY